MHANQLSLSLSRNMFVTFMEFFTGESVSDQYSVWLLLLFFSSPYCLWDPSMFIGIDPGRSYICTNLLIHSVLWLHSLSSWWISRVFPSFQLPRLPFKRNNHPAQIESCDYNWIGEEVSDCWQEHEVVSCLACAFLYRKCNWAEPRKSCDLG